MKKGTYLITGKEAEELCDMFRKNTNLRYRDVAKLFGTNDCTIRNTLKRCGLPLPSRYGNYSFPTTKFLKARWHANRKGIPFAVTKEELQVAWEKQKGICPYSGRPLCFPTSTRVFDGNASLDRVDSAYGYLPGNIQWVHKAINLLKYDFPIEYFLALCKSIVLYSQTGLSTPQVQQPIVISKDFKKFHGELETELCQYFQDGRTLHQLAKQYSVSRATIRSTLMRNGLTVGTPKTTFAYLSGTFTKLKKKALERSIELTVTMDYLEMCFNKQKGECIYTGWQLTFGSASGTSDGTASLDRIDSSKGYIDGNVQWVHKDVNLMKLQHSHENFISLCSEIVGHMKLLEPLKTSIL